MTRSKRGKGKRRQDHQQHQFKEHDKAPTNSVTSSGGGSRKAGDGAKGEAIPKRPAELAPVNIQPSGNSPDWIAKTSQTLPSQCVSTKGSEVPPARDSLVFDSLLDGLTGDDLHTATLIVEALRSPEDLSRLRRLAVTHGFVNDRIRAVVWPRLLGFMSLGEGGLKLGQLSSVPPSPRSRRPRPAAATATSDPHLQVPASPAAADSQGPDLRPPQREGGEALHRAVIQDRDGSAKGAVGLEGRDYVAEPVVVAAARRPRSSRGRGGAASVCGSPCDGGGSSRSRSSTGGRGGGGGGASGGASWRQHPDADPAATRDGEQRERQGASQEGGERRKRTSGSGCRQDQDRDQGSRGGRSLGSRDPCDASCRGRDRDGDGDSWVCDLRDWDWQQYLLWSALPHRDSAVVEVDVARSLWAFTRGLSDQQRDARRQQLKRLLNAVVAVHEGHVFYYQGLHDVASVLLMALPGSPRPLPLSPTAEARWPATAAAAATTVERNIPPQRASMDVVAATPTPSTPESAAADADADATAVTATATPADADAAAATATVAAADVDASARSELLAFALLRRLVTTHLRDATRPSLEPVVQLLGLMPYMVRVADPALGRHMEELGLQPFFALSWFLTWWAHELEELAPAARLYDFFLASHPLMPLYLGAVAMRSARAALLACEEMPELHSALVNLKLVAVATAAGGGGEDGCDGGRSAVAADGLSPLDELVRQAEELWLAKPPHTLVPPAQRQLRQRRGGGGGGSRDGGVSGGGDSDGRGVVALTACVAHAARMEGRPALWWVPDAAPLGWPASAVDGAGPDCGRSGLGRMLRQAASNALGARSRGALISTALLAGAYVAAAVAIGYVTFSRATGGQQ